MNKKIIPLEIVFSVVVIVIVISIITLICLQMNIDIKKIKNNSEASIIASNILENMNARSFEDIEKYIDEFSGVGVSKELEDKLQNIIIYGDEFVGKFFGTEIPSNYIVDFSLKDDTDFDILKNVDLKISYKGENNPTIIDLSTVIEREKITECNLPIITDDYFESLNINSKDYNIIPIKYSKNNNSYIITTRDDADWYNYSSKKWAKVIVLPQNSEMEKLFIDEHDKINSEVIIDGKIVKIEDFIYVWIPNFSQKDNISYFRYGTGKNAIRMSFIYSNNKYLYLNRVSEEIKDISPECSFDGLYGVWRKLNDEEDEYYKNFNNTRFAPINIY